MVHVDDLQGRQVITPANSLANARSVGDVRLSACVLDRPEKAEAVWRSMERAETVPVHQSFDWARAWTGAPDRAFLVVLVSLDGKPAILLPLEIVRKAGIRIARLIGTEHSNHNSPLYSGEFLVQADRPLVEQVVEALVALELPADLLVLDKLRAVCGPRRQPFLALPHVRSQNPSLQLPLLGSIDATLAQVNAKRRRRKFRVSERRLQAAGGYRHEVARDEATAQRFLTTFFEQKTARLTAQRLPDVFASPEVRDALRQLASFEAHGGSPVLKLHAVILGDQPEGPMLSVAGLTEKDGHVTCQFGSIDEQLLPDASAGELLFYLMIRQAAEAGATVFDFGVGDQPYKRSWCPVVTAHADVFVPLRATGAVAAFGMSNLVRAKRIVKASPRLRALADRLRALTVRQGLPAADEKG